MKNIPGSGSNTLYVKGGMFKEFRESTGLGRTLAMQGRQKMAGFMVSTMQNAFKDMARPKSNKTTKQLAPPALWKTPGFKNDRQFLDILTERGLVPERTQSEGAQGSEQQQVPEERSRSLGNEPRETNTQDSEEAPQDNSQADEEVFADQTGEKEKERGNDNEMADDQDQLQILADEIQDLEDEVKRLRKQRSDLRIASLKTDDKLKAWRDQAKEQEGQLARQRQKLDKQKEELNEHRRERDSRDRQLDDYIYENEELKEKIRGLEEQVLRLESEYDFLADLYSGAGSRRGDRKKRCVRREDIGERKKKGKK
jgi:chromosome segregation ATPase